jgi:hypothetical protein
MAVAACSASCVVAVITHFKAMWSEAGTTLDRVSLMSFRHLMQAEEGCPGSNFVYLSYDPMHRRRGLLFASEVRGSPFLSSDRIGRDEAATPRTGAHGWNCSGHDPGAGCGLNPAICMPRCASGFFMKVSQTKPVLAFSAMSMVMPLSMPTTSVSYQSVSGLKASTKP